MTQPPNKNNHMSLALEHQLYLDNLLEKARDAQWLHEEDEQATLNHQATVAQPSTETALQLHSQHPWVLSSKTK